jgi:glycine/D-amino acid oxidase-like deaminating enzyme
MDTKDFKIAVAGTGYVGLSIATLLSGDGSRCDSRESRYA